MMAYSNDTSFQMIHAREAISQGWNQITQQVTATENAVRGEPAFSFAFDLARNLVEGTCRTILTEREISYDEGDNLSALLKIVVNNLPLLPPGSSNATAARRSLEQTLSGLSTTMQGITRLRNQYGFASHGHATGIPEMEQAQAILIAGAADVIIGFLHRVHVQDRTVNASAGQSLYEANQDFNDFIDQSHEICIVLESDFWPSEVLFQMEPETYRSQLAAFRTEA